MCVCVCTKISGSPKFFLKRQKNVQKKFPIVCVCVCVYVRKFLGAQIFFSSVKKCTKKNPQLCVCVTQLTFIYLAFVLIIKNMASPNEQLMCRENQHLLKTIFPSKLRIEEKIDYYVVFDENNRPILKVLENGKKLKFTKFNHESLKEGTLLFVAEKPSKYKTCFTSHILTNHGRTNEQTCTCFTPIYKVTTDDSQHNLIGPQLFIKSDMFINSEPWNFFRVGNNEISATLLRNSVENDYTLIFDEALSIDAKVQFLASVMLLHSRYFKCKTLPNNYFGSFVFNGTWPIYLPF